MLDFVESNVAAPSPRPDGEVGGFFLKKITIQITTCQFIYRHMSEHDETDLPQDVASGSDDEAPVAAEIKPVNTKKVWPFYIRKKCSLAPVYLNSKFRLQGPLRVVTNTHDGPPTVVFDYPDYVGRPRTMGHSGMCDFGAISRHSSHLRCKQFLFKKKN